MGISWLNKPAGKSRTSIDIDTFLILTAMIVSGIIP